MLLDGLALLDEGVLGGGEAALHGGAQLGGQPGDGAGEALGEHFLEFEVVDCQLTKSGDLSWLVVWQKWCDPGQSVESDEVSLRCKARLVA